MIKLRSPYPLLVAFILLATAWNFIIPAYENLDEMEHAEVVRHIVATGQLPVHGDAEAGGFHVRQEASQPPLYHLLGAAWTRILGLPRTAPTVEPVPGAVVACGDPATFYNKTTWKRSPYTQRFPWSGHRRMVHGLRLLSTLLQALTVWGTWEIARRLFPKGSLPLLATAIVAFNPQFLLVAAGVNNDNLITPLATWALIVLVDIWQQGPSPARLLGFGALSGLAALSKLSGLALLGLGGLTLLIHALRERVSFMAVIRRGFLMSAPALALVAPWALHNLRLYGDPTALAPMLEIVGHREALDQPPGEIALMWRSYWGQLPCTFYPRVLYWPFALLIVGGCIGLGVKWRTLRPSQREGLLGLTLWFLIIVAAWIRWNLITPAPGGRLLFPAAPGLALLVAAGWTRFARVSSRVWAALLSLWALVTLITGPMHIFAPPPLKPIESVPETAAYSFGETIRLHDPNVRLIRPRFACWLSSSSYCQPTLELILNWEAIHSLKQDHVLAIQLVSAKPGDNTLRLSYNYWPGHGNLPTSVWPTDRIIADAYRLPIPGSDFSTQAWDVQIAFFDAETEERLPITLDGKAAGDAAHLTTLRVPDANPACVGMKSLKTPVTYGNAIALTHAKVTPDDNAWEVDLCWKSKALVTEDYTVFVHAYAADGTLLSTGDGPPMNQAFPTRLWEPGDRIVDSHTVTFDENGEPARIAVGFYHPRTGERLPAVQSGKRLPNDADIIWETP
jgi:4-amino-4-deoxy-L-arabinose transferase-like glycosyltransferase